MNHPKFGLVHPEKFPGGCVQRVQAIVQRAGVYNVIGRRRTAGPEKKVWNCQICFP